MDKVDELFPGFADEFEKKLQQALSSGAFDERVMRDAPYWVYKCVLIITAEAYGPPKGSEAEKLLKNLRHFI